MLLSIILKGEGKERILRKAVAKDTWYSREETEAKRWHTDGLRPGEPMSTIKSESPSHSPDYAVFLLNAGAERYL